MKKTQPKATKSKTSNKLATQAARHLSRKTLSPEFQALMTHVSILDKDTAGKLDIKTLHEELDRAGDEVNTGSMRLTERMAIAQANTLDHVFNLLTRRAFANLGGHWFEPYLRLALRAQAQSARTLETLAALKSPAIFTKQLNVANQQVVNQGSAPPLQSAGTPAELHESVSNSSFGEIENSHARA